MRHLRKESVFYELSTKKTEPNDIGRKQFFDYQSKGIYPKEENNYFKTLIDGKWQFDFLSSEYYNAFICGEWWGWHQLRKDWNGKWEILKALCHWHKNRPDWLLNS